MKKCTYCGKEFPDDMAACAVDAQPLETIKPPELKVPSARVAKPELPSIPTRILIRPAPIVSLLRLAFILRLLQFRWRIIIAATALSLGVTLWISFTPYSARTVIYSPKETNSDFPPMPPNHALERTRSSCSSWPRALFFICRHSQRRSAWIR
jgi:hypothetical protein